MLVVQVNQESIQYLNFRLGIQTKVQLESKKNLFYFTLVFETL